MTSESILCYEFDQLVSSDAFLQEAENTRVVPRKVFDLLDKMARGASNSGSLAWLRPSSRRGIAAIQLTSYVGVVRLADGTQIEILPKVGKDKSGGETSARILLLNMLQSMGDFRHIKTGRADLLATKRSLLEVFIGEFLQATETVVKRGLRGDYLNIEGNVFALRGKLQISKNLRHNVVRRDRFYVEYDRFSVNRPENRLIHTALNRVLLYSALPSHQRLGKELSLAFVNVPVSQNPQYDLTQVRFDRGMNVYREAINWARLIIRSMSPLTGIGSNQAMSMVYPMQDIFEAFVRDHLQSQVNHPYVLRSQIRRHSLVSHRAQDWFLLKPDLVVFDSKKAQVVMDTKWKLIDEGKADTKAKYNLAQSDFYQMHAYGQAYLEGQGDVVLIYPKTDKFDKALDVFNFPKLRGLRLWVLPFCLESKRLSLPQCGSLNLLFG